MVVQIKGDTAVYETPSGFKQDALGVVSIGGSVGGATATITQTVVDVGTTSVVLVAANPARKYLAIQNIGTAYVNLGFSDNAVLNAGWAIDPAAALGRQGGSMSFEPLMVTQQVQAIAAASTKVIILEGV